MNIDGKNRNVFCNQPGHCVVVDLYPTITADVLCALTKALANTLELAEMLRGSIRIPAFGLYVISNEFHTIWKLNSLRNNWSNIHVGITSLHKISLSCVPDHAEFEDNLKLSLQNILNHFMELPSVIKNRNTQCPADIDITFATMKSPDIVLTLLTSIITDMPIFKLKKIHIIPLSQINQSQRNVITSFDFIEINQLPLQTFFRSWLLDHSCKPDVILKFPETFGNFDLFCNLQECVLNPFSVPYGHAFQLQTDVLGASSISNSSNPILPLHKLEILKRLPQGALCDISMIGVPYCITPTAFWKLSSEKQKQNNNYFYALCYALGVAEECLLAKQWYDKHDGEPWLYGRFVIIPGNNMIIIRALAVSELMQPFHLTQCPVQKPEERAMAFMRSTLAAMPVLAEYKPEEHDSGLFDVLSGVPARNSTKTLVQSGTMKEPKKRKKTQEPTVHPALMTQKDIDSVINKKYKKNKNYFKK